MKLSKILLSGVVAAAMAVGMMGCAMDEDAHDIISVKGDTASVDYSNTSDDNYRGFETLRTKHTDAVAVITIDTEKSKGAVVEGVDSGRSGVLGFVFDLDTEKTKDVEGASKKVYAFTSASVRYNTKSKTLETYISRFNEVDPTKIDGGDNFKDLNGNLVDKVGKEEMYLKGSSGAYATLTGVTPDEDGLVKVAIEVIANEDGTYSVTYYDGNSAVIESKEDAKDESIAANKRVKTGQIKSGAKPLTITSYAGSSSVSNGTVKVNATWANANNKIKQTEIGFYAGVYAGATLTGSIQLPYIMNEDEVVEWED